MKILGRLLFFVLLFVSFESAFAGRIPNPTMDSILAFFEDLNSRAGQLDPVDVERDLKIFLRGGDFGKNKKADLVACALAAFFGERFNQGTCESLDLLSQLQALVPKEGRRQRKVIDHFRSKKKLEYGDSQDSVVEPLEEKADRVSKRGKLGALKSTKKKKKAKPEPDLSQQKMDVFLFGSPLKLQRKPEEVIEVLKIKKAFLAEFVAKASGTSLTKVNSEALRQDLLRTLPSFSEYRDLVSMTSSFLEPVVDPGRPAPGYNTVYKVFPRRVDESGDLVRGNVAALKVMSPANMDQSIQTMLILYGKTPYIPKLLAVSRGRKIISEVKQPLWSEVEFIPGKLEAHLSSIAVFEFLLGELAIRMAGGCIGDWKPDNLGFVVEPGFIRIYRVGRKIYRAVGPLIKRRDPGEIWDLLPQATSPGKCVIHAPDVYIPGEEEFNLQMEKVLTHLQLGKFAYFRSREFEQLFKDFEISQETLQELMGGSVPVEVYEFNL